jgi:nitrite reductase (NO-forming)
MDHHFDRRRISIMIAGMVVLPGIAFFTAPSGKAQEASPEASPAAGATPGARSANSVTITSHDIYFEPKEVTIPADTEVTVMLPNEGVTAHNFSITDHKNANLPFEPIDIDLPPGETEQVTINAPAGAYYFFCNIPGHEAAGMWGTLTVE